MLSKQAIGPRIKRISNALDRKRTQDMEDMELTSSQGFVLGYLTRRQGEPVTPGDLCRHFDLSQPTVTGILQRLETKGFILYADDSGDRRKKRVCVTEKAMDVHQRVVERFQETERLIAGGMTREELCTLRMLLDRVLANIGQVEGLDPCQNPKEEGT